MNVLEIQPKSYPYEIDGKLQAPVTLSDFIVDGISLSEKFDLDAWTASTCFEDMIEVKSREIKALLGSATPNNQWGSGRFVLYRCHCGCDYCGVISCEIVKEGECIHWKDVGYEGDDEPEVSQHIECLTFNFNEYEIVVNNYAGAST